MNDANLRILHKRHQRRILPTLLVTISLLLLGTGYMVWQERQQLLAQSAQAQRNLVNAMTDRLQTTLQKISMLTTLLADDILEHPRRVASTEYRARLARLADENPDIDMIVIVGTDGKVVVSSLRDRHATVDLSDRPYFRHHLLHPDLQLQIGTPLVNRATQKLFIPISRRISDRSGRFAGVVLIGIDSAALTREFQSLDLGPRSFVAIDHLNGHILSRHPPDPIGAGRNMRGTAQFEQHYSKKLSGSFVTASPVDGIERRHTFKRLPDHPLIMITGVSDADLNKAWIIGALLKAGYLVVLSAMLSLLAVYLYRKLGRLLQADSERQHALAKATAYQSALDDYVIVALLDRRGKVVEVNDRFCDLSGFSRQELVGRQLPPLDGRIRDIEFSATLISSLAAGTIWRGTRLARSKTGEEFWLNTCLLPLPAVEGDEPCFLLAQVDITSLKKAEERMASANQALSEAFAQKFAILNSASCGIIASDASGQIMMFNRAAETLLGYTSEEVRDRLSPASFHDPDDLAAALTNTHAADEGCEPDAPLYAAFVPLIQSAPQREWIYRRRDGTPVPVQLTVSPLCGPDGDVNGHVTVVTDLTQKKQLDRMKSDFVSVVSHELRTPLTAIKGAIALVTASIKGSASSQQAKLLAVANDSCDRLVRIVSDILDLDKLSRGKMPLNRQEQPLQPLLEKAIELNAPYAASSHVTLRLIGLDECLTADVDSDRFLQVMTNLLSNASKFSPPGGEVRVRLQASEHEAIIAVEDDGIGIPQAFHDKVFERFTQSEAAHTRRKGGSGLGLSIAKGFIDAHAGTLSFTSTEGVGTTFFVRLPRALVDAMA